MNKVFVDANYWIAITNERDQLHTNAIKARQNLGEAILITSDEVLIEYLNAFSKSRILRQKAALIVQAILSDSNIVVHQQSHHSFLNGLHRYQKREDKEYSLIDCITMNIMDSEKIKTILTSDNHFAQEGFTPLYSTQSEAQ